MAKVIQVVLFMTVLVSDHIPALMSPLDDRLLPSSGTPENYFYMYDDPALNYTYLLPEIEWPAVPHPSDKLYVRDFHPEPDLFSALRVHPLRTHEPEKARIFLVPMLIEISHLAARCAPDEENISKCSSHYRRLTESVKALQASPHWQAHQGRDHVLLCHFWRCLFSFRYADPLIETFRYAIVYHFESTRSKVMQTPWARKHYGKLGSVHRVLPYVDNVWRWRISGLFNPFPRNWSVFYSGNWRRSINYNVRPFTKVLQGEIAQRPDLRAWQVVDYGWNPNAAWSAAQMLRSQFCLCPAGDTSTSARIYYAIAAGCVPVIIAHHDIWLSLPFPTLLRWAQFAVFVPALHFKARPLAAVEHALSFAKYDELHAALRKVAPYVSVLHPKSQVAHALVTEMLTDLPWR